MTASPDSGNAAAARAGERFFALSADLLGVVALDGQFCSVNPSFERVLGYAAHEIMARPFIDFVHPDDRSATMAEFAAHVNGQASPSFENRWRHRDGSYRWLSWTSLAPDANLVYVAARDITPAKLQEEAERESAEARRESAERSRQAQKMEAVGRLAGGIAHDFNNMLAVILAYTSMLLEDMGPDAPMHADVEEIAKAAQRAAALTRQLLAFSRQQVLQPRSIDLNQAVRDVESMLGRLIGESVRIETRLAPSALCTLADLGQLQQIIVNLALNARDAMPNGGTIALETSAVRVDEVWAASHPEARAGPYVRLRVRDSGEGMDDETRDRAFDPFFTTKASGKGTGLGLSTAYGYVRQSGGHIALRSARDEGTTIDIYLPADVEARIDTPTPRPFPAAGPARAAATILIAEDESALREVTARGLEKRGYTVLTAANGEEALRLSRAYEGEIDLLLSDVVMPVMGGLELLRQLRPERPRTRAILMSGYARALLDDSSPVEDALLIEKPFTLDALLARMHELEPDGA